MTFEEFNNLWDKVICNQVNEIQVRFPDVYFLEDSKQGIFDTYNETIDYCKKHYMSDCKKRVDRHKISAAIVISVLKNEPIKYINQKYFSDSPTHWLFNEQLALTTGCSVLKTFILRRIKERRYEEYSSYSEEKLKTVFENGIVFPKTYHGSYKDNLLFEFYCMKKEGNYNLLSLADKFFLLEHLTFKAKINKVKQNDD